MRKCVLLCGQEDNNGDKTNLEKYTAPYGMKELLEEKKSDARGKYIFPDNMKLALTLPENNNPHYVIINATDEGDQGFKEFLLSTFKNA